MSLFKKRKGLNTIRQRNFGDEDDDDQTTICPPQVIENETGPQVPTTKEKKKSKNKEKLGDKHSHVSAVLSFGDELEADDGIVFQEKKSSLSYKLKKELKKERKEKKKEEKEKLKILDEKPKEKTVTELDELGIRIVNGREAEAIGYESLDEDEDDDLADEGKHKFRPKSESSTKSLDPWKKILESGKIPDANMIHMIRKKRQQAREQRDVIPVDDTVRLEQNKGRLIREDENDRSDEESSRLDFAVDRDATDRQQRKEAFDAAQDADDVESDHHDEWEQQQLMKSGANSKINIDGDVNSQDATLTSTMQPYSTGNSFQTGSDRIFSTTDTLIPGCSAALTRPTNYQAEGIIKRLKESRESFNEIHRRHKSEYDTIVDDLVSSKISVSTCSNQLAPLNHTFQFYQDMRGYVADLRECLNEKVVEISKLEQQVYLLYRQRTQKLIQRRRQDVKDQNNEFSPFAGKGALNDEFRIRRAAEREGRRTRRRREREKRGDTKHHNGTSTDDEEAHSEQQLMQTELSKIGEDAKIVFEDVENDFAQLEKIKGRFEFWKNKDFSAYSDAYVSFNLPKLFAPYIRLELLLWNPLCKESDNRPIEVERMIWYNELLLYGLQDDVDCTEKLRSDPDQRLMSHLVEKIVLVKLKELVTCCWDPLSHKQTVRLVNLVRHYAETYPSLSANSKPLKELTHTIIMKIKDSIDNDIFIPMFPKSVYESKTSGVSLFFQRQFWVAWKLLSSVLMWHNVLSDSVIHDLAIRSLLNLYLLPALNLASEINMSDALEKCRNVTNALPRAWAKNDINEDDTHIFLGRLEALLVAFAGKLDPSKNSHEIKEITELLKLIGAKKQSEIIFNKYL